ncbi:MAG: serine hydrolase, partial [Terriglobia bacterium]
MDELVRLERVYGGHLGVAAKDLNTGELIGYNAAERFPTASAIKFPIMTTFFHLVDKKVVDPFMKVVLTKEDKKQGSGLLQTLSDGATITLLDAVTLMITVSDNTAANLVLDRLADSHEARMKVVNDYMVANGLKNTRLLNRLYSRKTKQLSPEAIRYGIGVSTPDDMVMLLETLYNKTLGDSASCNSMLEIMKQQVYREMIPRFLPETEGKYLEVANKTGSINETKV